MTYLTTLILSVVEGITEFLPVSSTGHLILASHLFQIPPTEFSKSFDIFIQLGAIAAVVALYFRSLTVDMLKRLAVAFIPTGLIGFLVYPLVKSLFLENILITIISLFIGGVVLIMLEKLYQEQPHHSDSIYQLSYGKTALIGLFQAISIIPGVSRSAATIIGGLWLGLKRQPAVEFSFLLALPTLLAATGYDLLKSYHSFSSSDVSLLALGFVGAFVTAALTMKYFIRYIQRHTFIPFGVYRIVIAVVFWILFLR